MPKYQMEPDKTIEVTFTDDLLAGDFEGFENELKGIKANLTGTIGDHTFQDFIELQTATFSNVTKVGKAAFDNCRGLSNIALPNVKEIEEYTFSNCKALLQMELPNLEKMDVTSFRGCENLEIIYLNSIDMITISENIRIFEGCGRLKSIRLGAGKDEIAHTIAGLLGRDIEILVNWW